MVSPGRRTLCSRIPCTGGAASRARRAFTGVLARAPRVRRLRPRRSPSSRSRRFASSSVVFLGSALWSPRLCASAAVIQQARRRAVPAHVPSPAVDFAARASEPTSGAVRRRVPHGRRVRRGCLARVSSHARGSNNKPETRHIQTVFEAPAPACSARPERAARHLSSIVQLECAALSLSCRSSSSSLGTLADPGSLPLLHACLVLAHTRQGGLRHAADRPRRDHCPPRPARLRLPSSVRPPGPPRRPRRRRRPPPGARRRPRRARRRFALGPRRPRDLLVHGDDRLHQGGLPDPGQLALCVQQGPGFVHVGCARACSRPGRNGPR